MKNIIERLEGIRDSVAASQVDDDAHEIAAKESFETLIAEISEVRDKLSNDYTVAKQTYNRKNNELVRR